MLVDELELEAWLREAGIPSNAPAMRPRGKSPLKWPYNRISARPEAYAVHNVRPRLKVIPAEHLLQREEVAA
jgi:hypothetical protein